MSLCTSWVGLVVSCLTFCSNSSFFTSQVFTSRFLGKILGEQEAVEEHLILLWKELKQEFWMSEINLCVMEKFCTTCGIQQAYWHSVFIIFSNWNNYKLVSEALWYMWARTEKYKILCCNVIIASVNYTRKIPWLAKFRNSLYSELYIFSL